MDRYSSIYVMINFKYNEMHQQLTIAILPGMNNFLGSEYVIT